MCVQIGFLLPCNRNIVTLDYEIASWLLGKSRPVLNKGSSDQQREYSEHVLHAPELQKRKYGRKCSYKFKSALTKSKSFQISTNKNYYVLYSFSHPKPFCSFHCFQMRYLLRNWHSVHSFFMICAWVYRISSLSWCSLRYSFCYFYPLSLLHLRNLTFWKPYSKLYHWRSGSFLALPFHLFLSHGFDIWSDISVQSRPLSVRILTHTDLSLCHTHRAQS